MAATVFPLRPTAQGLHIGHERHAIALIEATRQYPNLFPLMSCRPSDAEPSAQDLIRIISHGNAFVFIPSNGLVRWSDCRRWGKSRQYKPFFRYFEEAPANSNGSQQLEGYTSLVKWSYSITFTPDLTDPASTIQYRLIWYVDFRRRHNLRPLSTLQPFATMNIWWQNYGPLCFEPVQPIGQLHVEGNGYEDTLPYEYRTRPQLQYLMLRGPGNFEPRPTFQLLDIRTEDEAILLIEAARQLPELFPPFRGRPTTGEHHRLQFERLIVHGNAFVIGITDNLIRWHDFKRWSNSHSLPPFLRYDQVEGATRRCRPIGADQSRPSVGDAELEDDEQSRSAGRGNPTGPLQRWTYSTHFCERGGTIATSYRLIWYIDPRRLNELRPVSGVPELRDLSASVPWHYYQRWNGERHSPRRDVAVPASSSSHGGPSTARRVAAKPPRPSPPRPMPATSSVPHPQNQPDRHSDPQVSSRPTLPPLRRVVAEGVVNVGNGENDPTGQGNTLPPIRSPIRPPASPVQGVGYLDPGYSF